MKENHTGKEIAEKLDRNSIKLDHITQAQQDFQTNLDQQQNQEL